MASYLLSVEQIANFVKDSYDEWVGILGMGHRNLAGDINEAVTHYVADYLKVMYNGSDVDPLVTFLQRLNFIDADTTDELIDEIAIDMDELLLTVNQMIDTMVSGIRSGRRLATVETSPCDQCILVTFGESRAKAAIRAKIQRMKDDMLPTSVGPEDLEKAELDISRIIGKMFSGAQTPDVLTELKRIVAAELNRH